MTHGGGSGTNVENAFEWAALGVFIFDVVFITINFLFALEEFVKAEFFEGTPRHQQAGAIR
jgi:hypothetical protein